MQSLDPPGHDDAGRTVQAVGRKGMPPTPAVVQSIAHAFDTPGASRVQAPAPDVGARIPDHSWACAQGASNNAKMNNTFFISIREAHG